MRPARKLTVKPCQADKAMAARTACTANGAISAVLFLLLSLGCFRCGIKGPPVPPRQPQAPTVADLAYRVSDHAVTLTWRLPEPLSVGRATPATFGLYRSRTALADPACDGCPLVFEKVAAVAYVHTDGHRYSIDVPVRSGYHYVFKVRLETDGKAGPDSNLVQFDHLPDAPSGGVEAQ
jgi:hypothetical protein